MPINVPQLNPQLLAGAAPEGLGELMPSFLGGMETQRKTQQQQATNVVNAQTVRLKLQQMAKLARDESDEAAYKKRLVELGPDWMNDPDKVRQARQIHAEIFAEKPDLLARPDVEEKIAMYDPALGAEALGSMVWVTPNGSEHANLSSAGWQEHDYKIPEKEEPGKAITYANVRADDPASTAKAVREGSEEETTLMAVDTPTAKWVPWDYKIPTEPAAKGLQTRYVFDIVENKVIADFSSTDTETIERWDKKKKTDRLEDGSQRYFTVPSPGGAATLSEGYGFESAASRDRALVQERSMDQAASMAREVLENIETGPWRAGFVATVRTLLQEFARISGDISQYVSDDAMRKFNVQTQRWAGNLKEPDGSQTMSKGLIQEFFDPKLSLTQLYENAMAIRWARYQYPTGRLLKEMVKDAKDATKISGFTSVQAVVERYEFMAEVFEDQAKWLGDQRERKQPAPAADTNVIETRRYDSEGRRIDTPAETKKTFASEINQASESKLLIIKEVLEGLQPTREVLEDLRLVEARLAQLGVTP